MEQETDLRAYIDILQRHWKWIAGLAVVAAILAFIVSSFLPPIYQATAVVLVTEPRYQMQFDPRFETAQGWKPAYQAFPVLAMSDGVLRSVVESHEPSPEAGIEDWRLRALRGIAEASSEGDPSLVLLRVQSRSAEDAAAIANAWADALVREGNEIYGGSESEVAFFEQQVSQALESLDAADATLEDFAARNEASIVEAQLESQRQAQVDYLGNQRAISYLVQDIRGLREQLSQKADGESLSPADALTALLLQINAFSSGVYGEEAAPPPPITLEITGADSLSDKSRDEQVAFLDELVATLQAKSGQIDTRLSELQPEILTLQQRLQEVTAEEDRLTRAQEVASETYLTLVRKLDEARIAAEEQNGVLQVGSYAAVPEEPARPRKAFNAAVAGMLGLIAGVVLAFAYEFWRQTEAQVPEEDG
jgi:uncharacterized protein involved in exopolysaccharide biosynthesis